MNITYLEKDRVLSYLVNHPDVCVNEYSSISREDIEKQTGYDIRLINSILGGFQQEGLISNLNLRFSSPSFYLEINQSASDLFNRGGFALKEQVLQKEVEKLLLEVERLKPSLGDKIEKISTIVNNIVGIVKPF